MRTRTRSRQKAFMLLDYTIGLSLAGLALMLLSWSVNEQRRAEHMLSQQRAAMRAAELAANCLLIGEAIPTSDDHVKITIQMDDASAPTNELRWAKIQAVMPSGAKAQLIAALPKNAEVR